MATLQAMQAFLATQGVDFGLKVVGALVTWVVGRWAIGLCSSLVRRAFERVGRIDVTLARYLTTIVSGLLTLVLVLAIFGIFGIQTTSLAALLAGLGLAIGVAWGGMLTHFAAGVFLQILKPFEVGDFVTAGGVTGTVAEVGVLFTKLVTPDNVETTIGNNKIVSDTIRNFSTLPYRRVDCTAKIANAVDPRDAMARLRTAVAAIPNVAASPPPDVEILSFTAQGPLLAVRPYTHTDHYWQVYFDTNKAIVDVFVAACYPAPELPILYHGGELAAADGAARTDVRA